jgi:hypothetical protein
MEDVKIGSEDGRIVRYMKIALMNTVALNK